MSKYSTSFYINLAGNLPSQARRFSGVISSMAKGQNLQQIAEVLCQPFNIQVIWQATEPKSSEKIPVWQVEPGETVFDTLSKLARHKGVMVTSDVEGNLVFTDPSKDVVGELTLGDNLLTLELNDDWSQRFSLYRVLGDAEQGGEKGNKSSQNGKKSGAEGEHDPDIYTNRKEGNT